MINQEKAHQKNTIVINESLETKVSVAFMGDVSFFGAAMEGINKFGVTAPFSQVLESLNLADFRICNLESVILDNVESIKPPSKKAILYSDSRALQALLHGQIDLLTFANNHMMDAGSANMLRCIQMLNDVGMGTCGAGENINGARKPYEWCINDINFKLLAYSYDAGQTAKKSKPGCAPSQESLILDDIRSKNENTDILIVCLHEDAEFQETPSPDRIQLCHNLVDCGANVVICHHPHVLQGIEIYKNSLIAYSLGNYVSRISEYMMSRSKICHKSCHLTVHFSKDGVGSLDIVPVLIDSYGFPYPALGKDADDILTMIKSRSDAVLDSDKVKRNYRKMLRLWQREVLNILYWSMRKFDAPTFFLVLKDLFYSKQKQKWLKDLLFNRY